MSSGNPDSGHLLKLDEWGKRGAKGIRFKVVLILKGYAFVIP